MSIITTTASNTSPATGTPKPKRTTRLTVALVGAGLLVAGGVTATIVDHSQGTSTRLAPSAPLHQAALTKAERLQGQVDSRTATGDALTAAVQQAAVTKDERLQGQVDSLTATSNDDLMRQLHAVTGAGAAAQEARTRLYHQLRGQ